PYGARRGCRSRKTVRTGRAIRLPAPRSRASAAWPSNGPPDPCPPCVTLPGSRTAALSRGTPCVWLWQRAADACAQRRNDGMTTGRTGTRAATLLATVSLLLVALGMQPRVSRAADDAPVLIRGATVFDGTDRAPVAADVLVEDGRISAVGPSLPTPAGATVVDAEGRALLPGLFDVHTHWTPNGVPATLPEIANAYIAAGVTTVNDYHQAPESYAPRRAWLQ